MGPRPDPDRPIDLAGPAHEDPRPPAVRPVLREILDDRVPSAGELPALGQALRDRATDGSGPDEIAVGADLSRAAVRHVLSGGTVAALTGEPLGPR